MVPWVCGSGSVGSQLAKGRGGPYDPYLVIFLWRLRRLHLVGTTRIRLTSCEATGNCVHLVTLMHFLPWNHGTHGASVRHSSALLLPSLAGLAAYQSSSATLLLCLLASVTCREAGDGRCSLRRPVSDHVPLPSPNTPESTRENGFYIHQSPPRATSDQQPGMLLLRSRYVDDGCVRSRMAVQLQHVNAYQVTIRHSASCMYCPSRHLQYLLSYGGLSQVLAPGISGLTSHSVMCYPGVFVVAQSHSLNSTYPWPSHHRRFHYCGSRRCPTP